MNALSYLGQKKFGMKKHTDLQPTMLCLILQDVWFMNDVRIPNYKLELFFNEKTDVSPFQE